MNFEPQTYHSSGKLLLTGEYVVLDGAAALAVPTKFGQSLDVKKTDHQQLKWTSYNEKGVAWFSSEFEFNRDGSLNLTTEPNEISERLLQILNAAQKLNPKFLKDDCGFEINTQLGFPQNWGLGTSSTLVNNIANWAKVDAYKLLDKTFGGSGYDIACASSNSALTYRLVKNKEREISRVVFDPSFKKHLYFVHLNQKQNSRKGIARYRANTSDKSELIFKINAITDAILVCKNIAKFQELMTLHELLIGKVINQIPVKKRLFPDFRGSIKSLGAWGGDFVMVAAAENPEVYFKGKGFHTILRFEDMVKEF